MRFERPVRLPLQVGASAVWNAAIASATVVPAAVLLLVSLVAAVLAWIVVIFAWEVALFVLFLEGFLVYTGVKRLRRALRQRPTDVILDRDGLRFEGGKRHGQRLAWGDIDGARSMIEPRKDSELADLHALVLCRRDGNRMEVAVADNQGERQSLAALLATIQAAAGGSPPAEPPPPSGPVLLACGNCGAAVRPEVADQVTCASCGQTVAVSRELRERIRAAAILPGARADSARLVERLLEQPGAHSANLWLTIGALPAFAAWFVALITGVVLWTRAQLETSDVFLLSVFAVATVLGVAFLLQRRIVDRGALHLITVGLSADPPVEEGGEYRCRQCAAPLPPAAGEVLARCAYCATDNVMGLDLRAPAEQAWREKLNLGKTLEQRRTDRRRWTRWALWAALGAVVGALAFRHAVGSMSAVVAARSGCYRQDDADACIALGQLYKTGEHGELPDWKGAGKLFDRACELGSQRGCTEAAGQHLALAGGETDAAARDEHVRRGNELYRTTCDAGYLPACGAYAWALWLANYPDGALPLAARACDGGEPVGCGTLAWLVRDSDPPRASRAAQQACAGGNGRGCTALGTLRAAGTGGLAKDDAAAAGLWQQGCERGDPLGCHFLGEALDTGTGVARDSRRARKLWYEACEYQGLGVSCAAMGFYFVSGRASQKDIERGKYYLGMACYHGAAEACLARARWGTPEEAARDRKRACDLGLQKACAR